MTPYELISKWRDSELRERQGAQEWFLDICRLAGHPTPAESDKTGETFCFERGAEKVSGGGGWADVWKRRHFGWEFKGRHQDLDRAYRQLAEYRDAILDLTDPGDPREPEWPKVDFIVGNPPFLGGKFLRRELGDEYVDRLFELWDGRVRREADLCCYWFEKARAAIEGGRCRRAGLLATQAIRGGANREVLRCIKDSGDIFFAVSDREWVLDGANVHVSLIGFDDGAEEHRVLDERPVAEIHSNLTAAVDLEGFAGLAQSTDTSFMAITAGHSP